MKRILTLILALLVFLCPLLGRAMHATAEEQAYYGRTVVGPRMDGIPGATSPQTVEAASVYYDYESILESLLRNAWYGPRTFDMDVAASTAIMHLVSTGYLTGSMYYPMDIVLAILEAIPNGDWPS